MPKLLILSDSGKSTTFDLFRTAIVGRGEDCDLLLDDPSVSRQHARFELDDRERVRVSDLGSANGVLIDGKPAASARLKHGSEVAVGRFTLVLCPDGQTFYRGRCIAYMEEHGTVGTQTTDATTPLGSDDVQRLIDERRLINGGRIALASDPTQFWYPQTRKITFGDEGMVPIKGWFTGGLLAEVAWDGNGHVLRNLTQRLRTKVNDSKVESALLQEGDRVEIGGSRFVYEIISYSVVGRQTFDISSFVEI
jgi:pSer/pThr/pTyr-binding forkhead associated (FHA) protein